MALAVVQAKLRAEAAYIQTQIDKAKKDFGVAVFDRMRGKVGFGLWSYG